MTTLNDVSVQSVSLDLMDHGLNIATQFVRAANARVMDIRMTHANLTRILRFEMERYNEVMRPEGVVELILRSENPGRLFLDIIRFIVTVFMDLIRLCSSVGLITDDTVRRFTDIHTNAKEYLSVVKKPAPDAKSTLSFFLDFTTNRSTSQAQQQTADKIEAYTQRLNAEASMRHNADIFLPQSTGGSDTDIYTSRNDTNWASEMSVESFGSFSLPDLSTLQTGARATDFAVEKASGGSVSHSVRFCLNGNPRLCVWRKSDAISDKTAAELFPGGATVVKVNDSVVPDARISDLVHRGRLEIQYDAEIVLLIPNDSPNPDAIMAPGNGVVFKTSSAPDSVRALVARSLKEGLVPYLEPTSLSMPSLAVSQSASVSNEGDEWMRFLSMLVVEGGILDPSTGAPPNRVWLLPPTQNYVFFTENDTPINLAVMDERETWLIDRFAETSADDPDKDWRIGRNRLRVDALKAWANGANASEYVSGILGKLVNEDASDREWADALGNRYPRVLEEVNDIVRKVQTDRIRDYDSMGEHSRQRREAGPVWLPIRT